MAVALFAAFLALTAAFVGVATQTNALSREGAALRAEIAALQVKHVVLDAAAAERRTESYIVDKAREYDYVRPNESLITIQQAPTPRPDPVADPGAGGHLAKWFALFFGAR
ncbi:MAG: septum formation initiator family protein [Candidatus Limnocylindria bacterium]